MSTRTLLEKYPKFESVIAFIGKSLQWLLLKIEKSYVFFFFSYFLILCTPTVIYFVFNLSQNAVLGNFLGCLNIALIIALIHLFLSKRLSYILFYVIIISLAVLSLFETAHVII